MFGPAASILFLLPSAAVAQHFPPDDELRLMLRYIVDDAGAAGMVLGVLEADESTRSRPRSSRTCPAEARSTSMIR
jgi:hypothetical protein